MNIAVSPKPFYSARIGESEITFYQGDSLRVLRSLPLLPMFDMGINSPAYYQIFNYLLEGQYGLEGSLPEYIAKQVEVHEEIRLRMPQGGCQYIVVGDTMNNYSPICSLNQRKSKRQGNGDWLSRRNREAGFQEKEPMNVPFRLAEGLRSLGWRCRSMLVWDKGSSSIVPNSDTAPACHEYVLQMVRWDKNGRFYANTNPLKSSILSHRPDSDPEHGCVFPQSLSDELMRSLSVEKVGRKPVILDCYLGRGTTAWSAIALGYDFVGIDLDCSLAVKRLREKFSNIKENHHE